MPKRVQFDLSDNLYQRSKPYVDDKHLNYQISLAFDEWLKRREARSLRAEIEKRRKEGELTGGVK